MLAIFRMSYVGQYLTYWYSSAKIRSKNVTYESMSQNEIWQITFNFTVVRQLD